MISEGSIGRSIAHLAFRIQADMHAKRAEGKDSALAETDQQFQIETSGEAAPTPAWRDIEIVFDETIFLAPAQRSNPLEEPHFTFGSTMQSDTPVILHATVRKWIKDTSGNFTGAVVSIGVTGGNETEAATFKATVHCVFQGFSGPNYPATGVGEG